MAMNEKFFAEAGFRNFGVAFLSADSTASKVLFSNPTAEGVIVKSINISSNDSAQNFQLIAYDGTNEYPIGTIGVPANAGQNGSTQSVNLLDGVYLKGLEKDVAGNSIIKLAGGWSLKGKMLVAVNTGKQISVFGVYASMTAV